jgi:hypothetical protein
VKRVALVAALIAGCSPADKPPAASSPPPPARDAAVATQVTGSVAHPFDAGPAPDPKNDPRTFSSVSQEVACPAVRPPVHDATLLADTSLVVSPDGFLRPDIGVPEAVALLGDPVQCDDSGEFGLATWALFPHAANAHPLRLELDDDQLAGIDIRFATPVAVDMVALAKRFGAPHPLPEPPYAGLPDGDRFEVTTDAYVAQLMFNHRDAAEPPTAWHVTDLIFRREPKVDIIPFSYRTEADVQRLIALALRPRAPLPVQFFGYIGTLERKDGDHITLVQGGLDRNITMASIERRTVGKRDYLKSLSVAFTQPIAVTSIAATPNLDPTIVDGKLTALTIVRGP